MGCRKYSRPTGPSTERAAEAIKSSQNLLEETRSSHKVNKQTGFPSPDADGDHALHGDGLQHLLQDHGFFLEDE